MSLYNMVNGVQMATFFVLPMLGKHPDDYPRYRDCFIGKMTQDFNDLDQFGIPTLKHGKENLISVYTRTGGANRNSYQSAIRELEKMPEYVENFDDAFDNTFAIFVFKVPIKFLKDFQLIKDGKLLQTSKNYQKQVDKVYPKLKDKLPWHLKPKSDLKKEEKE